LLDRERFVFYPMADNDRRWYDLGVTPTLGAFFGGDSESAKKQWRPHREPHPRGRWIFGGSSKRSE